MHGKFLLEALAEAKLGQGLCAPNPSVGAVAVKEDKIIARAFHKGAGTPHAEQLVIAQLPENITGVTLYVTLEPCNHYGRTPPCVDAIVQYGFSRVVFAYSDPNPIVAKNNTVGLLRAHGVEVIQNTLPEIEAFYQHYKYWMHTGIPWVTAKMAQSFDGKIAGAKGERIKLSNETCNQFTHENRLLSDIILTTARTVNADNPQMNVRLPEFKGSKTIAIIDSRLELNPVSTVLSTASYCHIFYNEKCKAPEPVEKRTYHPVPADNGQLSLQGVMQILGNLGYHHVWLEAGSRFFGAMHQARLVQRTYIYLAPIILGLDAVTAYGDIDILNGAKQVTWCPMDDNMRVTLDWESTEKEQLCSQV